jgi:hypothetical protein
LFPAGICWTFHASHLQEATMRAVAIIQILVLALSGCTQPTRTLGGPELLAAAHRSIGATDTIRTVWSVATVASPSGGFEASIASARDGRVRLALGKSLIAGVNAGKGWRCDSTGQVAPLDSVLRSVVRGHDLHMLVLSPGWMGPPAREADRRWGTDSVMTLRFADELGAPLLMHLRNRDSLPLGLDVVNHTGSGPREVRVLLEDWRDLHGVRLFRSAIFEHGGNRFVYSYNQLQLNTLPDSGFAPSCA